MENKIKKISVLMVSAQYLPEVFGGAEQQCQKLSEVLHHQENIKVTVLTSRSNKKIPKDEIRNGVSIVRLHSFAPPQIMSISTLHATFIWMIKSYLWIFKKKNDYDIIHIHQAKLQAFLGVFLSKVLKKAAIVKVGNAGKGFDLTTLRRKIVFGEAMYQYVVKKTDYFIAISTVIARELAEIGISSQRILFLPNGVRLPFEERPSAAEKAERRALLGCGLDTKVFLFLGRLEKQKDVEMLVSAFDTAKQDLGVKNAEKMQLWIVGDGSLRNNIEKLIKKLTIDNFVKLWGYQKEVLPYIVASDYFVLSTEGEGLSNALLEAMSIGIVPISTNVSGSNDLIRHEVNGFLTESKNLSSLAGAIKKAYLMNSEQYNIFSEKCFEKVKKFYKIEKIASDYAVLYKKILITKS